MPKTIAELRQELQDAGRDVRMAGEMIERVTGGMLDSEAIFDADLALVEANGRMLRALTAWDKAQRRIEAEAEAAK